MGGVEIIVPVAILILLYFLLPAYLHNRQKRLVEAMEISSGDNLVLSGEVNLKGKWLKYPGVLTLTKDAIIIQSVLSLYPDEIPLERIRGLSISNSIVTLISTDLKYQMFFPNHDIAEEWKNLIENSI